MNRETTKKVNFCLTQLTKKQVEGLAQLWDRSVSSTIRFLISQAYKKELEGGKANEATQ